MGSGSKYQPGGVLVIVVIVLSLVVAGLVSFVFWQNFMKPTTTKVTTSETKIVTVPENAAEAEALNGSYSLPVENLYFEYPSSWEFISKYNNTNGNVDNRTLLVSDNNFALEINISSYGPNWPFGERPVACPFDEGYNANTTQNQEVCPQYDTLVAEPSSNLPGNSVYIFKTTYPKSDTLKGSASLTLAKNGCSGLELALCERPDAKTGYYLYVNGNYYEEITETNKKEGGMYSDANVKQMNATDFVKSQDVQTAIAVLKSIKYQN